MDLGNISEVELIYKLQVCEIIAFMPDFIHFFHLLNLHH